MWNSGGLAPGETNTKINSCSQSDGHEGDDCGNRERDHFVFALLDSKGFLVLRGGVAQKSHKRLVKGSAVSMLRDEVHQNEGNEVDREKSQEGLLSRHAQEISAEGHCVRSA
jgi:hypothetical protein